MSSNTTIKLKRTAELISNNSFREHSIDFGEPIFVDNNESRNITYSNRLLNILDQAEIPELGPREHVSTDKTTDVYAQLWAWTVGCSLTWAVLSPGIPIFPTPFFRKT